MWGFNGGGYSLEGKKDVGKKKTKSMGGEEEGCPLIFSQHKSR